MDHEETLEETRDRMRRVVERRNVFNRLVECVNEICDQYGLPNEELDANAKRDR